MIHSFLISTSFICIFNSTEPFLFLSFSVDVFVLKVAKVISRFYQEDLQDSANSCTHSNDLLQGNIQSKSGQGKNAWMKLGRKQAHASKGSLTVELNRMPLILVTSCDNTCEMLPTSEAYLRLRSWIFPGGQSCRHPSMYHNPRLPEGNQMVSTNLFSETIQAQSTTLVQVTGVPQKSQVPSDQPRTTGKHFSKGRKLCYVAPFMHSFILASF